MFKEILPNYFEEQDLVELCRDWLITLTPAESKFSTSTAAKVQLDLSKVDKSNFREAFNKHLGSQMNEHTGKVDFDALSGDVKPLCYE